MLEFDLRMRMSVDIFVAPKFDAADCAWREIGTGASSLFSLVLREPMETEMMKELAMQLFEVVIHGRFQY